MIRCASKDYSDSLTFDINGVFDDTYKVENLPIEFSGSIIKDTQVDRKQLPTGHLIVSLNKVKMQSSNENGSLAISLGEQPQGTETLSDLSYFNDPSQHDVKGRLTVNFDFFRISVRPMTIRLLVFSRFMLLMPFATATISVIIRTRWWSTMLMELSMNVKSAILRVVCVVDRNLLSI